VLSEVSDESEVRKGLSDENIKSLIKGEEYFNTTMGIVLVIEKNSILILICSNKTTSD
jgi:hypothetical protein